MNGSDQVLWVNECYIINCFYNRVFVFIDIERCLYIFYFFIFFSEKLGYEFGEKKETFWDD